MKALGLVLITSTLLIPALAGAQSDVWSQRRLPWRMLPQRELVGSAPTSLETPGAIDECGAVSERIDLFAAKGPVVLRVRLRMESGAVSLSVRDEAAKAILSKLKIVKEGDGEQTAYIRLEPRMGPRVLALCNPGQAASGGRVDVLAVDAARADDLPADDAAKVNLGSL